jgi:replicative DNA helicase
VTDDHNAPAAASIFYDHNAERAVLGAMLADGGQIAEVEPILTADAFHHPAHPLLFTALVEQRQADQPTDPVSLVAHLAATGRVGRVPDRGTYVSTLFGEAPAPQSATHFARIVAERALRRQYDAELDKARAAIRAGAGTAAELMEAHREAITKLAERTTGGGDGYRLWNDVASDSLEKLERRRNGLDSDEDPISTGFTDVDKALGGGLRQRELVVIAGQSGEGKSTFASDIVREHAFHQWLPVGVVTMEMPENMMFNRLVCAEAGVRSDGIRDGFTDIHDWSAVNEVCKETTDAPLFIDDTRGQTFADIRLRAKRLKDRYGIVTLVVDYLGLIECRDDRPRNQQVDDLARRFHGLADELDVCLILLAQLNRNVVHRSDKRPQLNDLKESGGIAAHANTVIFVHRPERHGKDDRPGEADLIIAKARSGEEKTIPVAAQLHFNRFFSMAY